MEILCKETPMVYLQMVCVNFFSDLFEQSWYRWSSNMNTENIYCQ